MKKEFEITDEVMEKINGYSVKELSPEEVFCFSVVLCDNDIDRDYERFSVESLKILAELFKGKTGIFDHDVRSENQTARIFDTAVLEYLDRETSDGQAYFGLTGYAYMVRTEDNKSLIAEIQGGIKKEVSVSCSVGKKLCSICGADQNVSPCMHVKGKTYGEEVCHIGLEEPADAYEWSFVAVPAQKKAGVIKKFTETEFQHISADKKEELRKEILILSYFAKPFETAKAVSELTEGMDETQLEKLCQRLREQTKDHGKGWGSMSEKLFTEEDEKENDEYKI